MSRQAPLIPFRQGTRQRFQKVGTVALTAGQSAAPLEFPRVGLINYIIVQIRGTVTLSGAGALADMSPWNVLSRLRFDINIGSASIVDVSGYGAFCLNLLRNHGYRPDRAGSGDTTPSADYFIAPVANGANTVAFTYVLPIAANNFDAFDSGLINLQAPEVRTQLTLTQGAVTEYSSLATASSLTAHVYYCYYELPDPTQVSLPPLMLVRSLEEQQGITQTGDQIYQVPRMGNLLQDIIVTRLNGSRSDSVDEVRVTFNKTDTPYRMERQALRVINRMATGVEMPTGVNILDFYNSMQLISAGDQRDVIDTEAIATTEIIPVITSGATLGAGNNFLHNIRRIVQLLQM